jgi:hypothetical protein
MSGRKHKNVTSTTRVLDALIRADDFRTSRQLQLELSLDVNHISASLYHLRKYCAVDFVEGTDALWWFATPDSDCRQRAVHERAPESVPRRPRKRRMAASPAS